MSLDADSIVDRRRLRRKLTFWRICAILFVIVALVAVGGYVSSSGEGSAGSRRWTSWRNPAPAR